jgi:hypothetical protein
VTLNTTHTGAGTYNTDTWSFTGTGNYNNIAATTITDTITPANTSITYTGDMLVGAPNSFNLKAQLTSSAGTCQSAQSIRFFLDDNPTTSTADGQWIIPGTFTTNSSGLVTGTASTTGWIPGVYDIKAEFQGTVNCNPSVSEMSPLVVYDPSAGFVTGGGWINSLAGSCKLSSCTDATTGKATFGFVSKYLKGANVPTGNTEFQFQAGGLNFKSTVYEWLVVSGSSKAQYKGSGTINGGGSYGFLLTANDGGNSGVDKFRIKIWDKGLGDGTTTVGVVYDNKMGLPNDIDTASPQDIGGGSIVIHK